MASDNAFQFQGSDFEIQFEEPVTAETVPKRGRGCCICYVEPCVAKFNYCKECKKDVQSCAIAAKAEGREDDFQKFAKTNAGLRHLMLHCKAK